MEENLAEMGVIFRHHNVNDNVEVIFKFIIVPF